jgi:lycopene beta-cyclase
MLDSTSAEYDYVVVGGGLHGCLIALAVLARSPRARVALLERGSSLGGNHVWCFHAGDVPRGSMPLVEPLVEAAWPGYDVEFRGYVRHVEQTYSAVTSGRLDRVVRRAFEERPDCTLVLDAVANVVSEREVVLVDGRRFDAKVVIVATGPEAGAFTRRPAFQKFLGLELELARPAPRDRPLLMDATVPQRDGFRFFYVLPFTSQRALIEDTYFSTSPALDTGDLEREILEYAARNGYVVQRVLRRESGVLPLPLAEENVLSSAPGPFVAGYRGGWFHPTTGYSFPLAARVANLVARTDPTALRSAWPRLVSDHKKQFRFCLLLNRLLYGAFAAEDRHHVIQRFYRLPAPVLARFYAMTLTPADRVRVFCSRPPRGFSLRLALSGGMSR